MNTLSIPHLPSTTKSTRIVVAAVTAFSLLAATFSFASPASALECIRAPHTVTVNQPIQDATPGQTIYFTFTITNNDTGDCGTSEFTFDTANKPADWTVAPYNGIERVDVGEYTDYGVWYTVPTDVYNGPYKFPVEIYRAEEPTIVTVPVQMNVTGGRDWVQPDTSAPVVSSVSPATNSTVRKNAVTTLSAVTSDNVAVTKVAFYVNGTLLCQGTANTCAWNVPNAKATYQITVKAYDAAGNIGTSSTTLNAR